MHSYCHVSVAIIKAVLIYSLHFEFFSYSVSSIMAYAAEIRSDIKAPLSSFEQPSLALNDGLQESVPEFSLHMPELLQLPAFNGCNSFATPMEDLLISRICSLKLPRQP